jgi:hypothetical protein
VLTAYIHVSLTTNHYLHFFNSNHFRTLHSFESPVAAILEWGRQHRLDGPRFDRFMGALGDLKCDFILYFELRRNVLIFPNSMVQKHVAAFGDLFVTSEKKIIAS